MRVMSFIALFAAIGYTYMVLSKENPTDFGVFIITGWLVASFAPKAIQKFAEKDILQGRQ
jgi:predicted membrane channel-forming protein YqfA (hemolysin III family)